MDAQITVQDTPNPGALKFVLNVPVKTDGNITHKNAAECANNPLARHLFEIGNIAEVYFFDNYITVTRQGDTDWGELEKKVQEVILKHIKEHNPDFKAAAAPEKETPRSAANPEIARINAILNQTIRPALQMDGGDLQIVNLEGNILSIQYQGACGSCPSATMGTKAAIEDLLREQYKPDIVVELA